MPTRPAQNLTVLRDQSAPYLNCPSCQTRIELGSSGSKWSVRSPRDVTDRLMVSMSGLEREELHVLLMNTKNVVLDDITVYQGNVSAAVVRVGELFTAAIRRQAAGIILVHTHPSGDPEPSADDLHLTAETIAAGRLLDMQVLDHIVVARDGYVSLRDRGVAFERR